MGKKVYKLYLNQLKKLRIWSGKHLFGLLILNLILMGQILLSSAGYFRPFFALTINSIVVMALISSIFLLDLRSKGAFFITLLFWLFAALLKIVHIDVWAERTVIYVFESLVIGMTLLLLETMLTKS